MLNEQVRRSPTYEGTGTNGPFSFDFKIFRPTQVAVELKTVGAVYPRTLEASEYETVLNEKGEGGQVTLAMPLRVGESLSIVSAIPYDQILGLDRMGSFNPEDLVAAWDRNCALIQQLLEKLSRAILLPPMSEMTADELVYRLLETYELAQQVVAIADEIKALGPVADDIAALGPHAEAIQRISDRLEDLLQIDGIIAAIEDIEQNVEEAQDAADSAQAAADRAEDLLGGLEGVFEENEALAALTENYMLILTSTAATTAAAFTKRDIEHWNMWYEDGLNKLRVAGTIALYSASTTQNDIEHFVAWFTKGEEEETELLTKLSETSQTTKSFIETSISEHDSEMVHRNLLIRTYVEKPPVLFIVAGQSNAVGFVTPPYEAAKYCGTFWNWQTGVNALQSLKDPTNASKTNGGSAWPAFARHFFELTHRKVCILNIAQGGAAVTPISSNTWYGVDSALRQRASTQYAAVTAALGTLNDDYVLGGILWIQGEAETAHIGNGNTTAEAYKAGTLDVFAFFRQLTSDADLPVYMSQIGFYEGAFSNTNWMNGHLAVQQAQVEMAEGDTNHVYLVFEGAKTFNKAGYMHDSVHYSQYGYNIVGKAFARFIANHQFSA